MAAEIITNNATTTLTAAITTNVQATINVLSAALYPTSGQYRLLIDNEYLLVTSGQGTTTWGVQRGVEGTTATTHLNGAPVTGIITGGAIANLGPSAAFATLAVAGKTGAGVAAAYAGATASGAPSSGTFLLGDWIIDLSGNLWICTVGGTPGTWVSPIGALPKGTLSGGYAQLTTAPTAISSSTPTDVTGLSATVTVPAGRRLRVSHFAYAVTGGTNDTYFLVINADGAEVSQCNIVNPGAQGISGFVSAILQPGAGSHTYKVQASRNGVDNGVIQASSAAPAYILVEDIGT